MWCLNDAKRDIETHWITLTADQQMSEEVKDIVVKCRSIYREMLVFFNNNKKKLDAVNAFFLNIKNNHKEWFTSPDYQNLFYNEHLKYFLQLYE